MSQLAAVVERENHVRVLFNRGQRIDEAQLPRHSKMDDEKKSVVEFDEDEFPPPPNGVDGHAGDRVDELLGLREANDGWEKQLAADNGSAGQVRPQVRDDRLDLW